MKKRILDYHALAISVFCFWIAIKGFKKQPLQLDIDQLGKS